MEKADKSVSRILLVEDEKEISELLSTFLEKNGFEVVACQDGDSALENFKNEKFSLIMLDLMLPGKDGYEILREIRSQEKAAHTPVILLSALAQKTEIEKGLKAGADFYITKPYENKFLLEQIKRLLNE